jgi:transcriptional regulator with XRE-family HTH domain
MENPLPQRLKAARCAARLTQMQLGQRLGLDDNTASARMNQYEKGKHNPDYQTLQRIAEVLGVPVAYFYCDDDALAELICVLAKQPSATTAALLVALNTGATNG